MNNKIKSVCGFIVLLFSCTYLYAGDNPSTDIPTIKTIFASPNFNQGYINISITNAANFPVHISPKLQDGVHGSANSGLVYVSMQVTKIPDVRIDYTPEEMDSMLADNRESSPIEISPGEKKEIKFSFPKYYIKAVKALSGIKLTLTYNHTVIQAVEFNNIDGVWNIKQ